MRKIYFILLLSIVSLVSMNAQTVIFDPSGYAEGAFQESSVMTIVTIDGEKYLKVEIAEWSSAFEITPVTLDENMDVFSAIAKYEEGTSGFTIDMVNTFIKLADNSAGDFAEIGVAAAASSAEFIEYKGNIALNSATVTNIQVAGQETTAWAAITGDFIYLGKIIASNSEAEAQLAVAPNTTEVAYSDIAKDIYVDGLFDDVYGTAINDINRVALNETGGDILESSSSGNWLAVADLDNFYIYIEVTDDDQIELGESTSPWMNDGIELFMDIQNRRYIDAVRITSEQHQIRINYGTEGPAHGTDAEGISLGMPDFFGSNDTTNIEFQVLGSSLGYVIEARIPWATWYRTQYGTNQEALDAIALVENMKVAFEVSILDANAPDGRQSILNWANNTGEDVAYVTNEFYGEITLKGGWPVSVSDKVKKSVLGVYPNPANNVLNISMENAGKVQVFNVLGAKVIDKELNGAKTINVANLTNGVYIIKVADNKGKIAVAKFNKN